MKHLEFSPALPQSVLSARVLDLVTSVLCLPWRDTGAGENVLICRFCQNYPNSPVDPKTLLILPPSGPLKHCPSALNLPNHPSSLISRVHDNVHDDMIMYAIMHDQHSVHSYDQHIIAMINSLS